MPIIKHSDFKSGIKDGKYTIFSIDTNIFEEKNYSFLYGPLLLLNDLDDNITFIITNIVYRETLKRFISKTEKNILDAKKSISHVKHLDKFSEMYNYMETFDVKAHCTDVVNSIFNRKNNIKIDSSIDILDLVDSYFSQNPPFGNKEKQKYEFPDAIALWSLEQYARNNTKEIVILSKDKGWLNFCSKSKILYAYTLDNNNTDILQDAIFNFRFKTARKHALTQKLECILRSERSSHIKQYLTDSVELFIQDGKNIDEKYTSDYTIDLELSSIALTEIDFTNANYEISYFDSTVVLFECLMPIVITAEAYVEFFAYDSEDKDYLKLDGCTASAHENIWIELSATIGIEDNGEFDGDSTIEIDIRTMHIPIDFGELDFPDHYEYRDI